MEDTWLLQDPQASSPTKVTCYLPKRESYGGSAWYYLSMYVDGEKVTDTGGARIKFDWSATPEIKLHNSPRYVEVQSVVNFTGRIFTNLYGSTGPSDGEALDQDNDKHKIVGAFLGEGQDCLLMDDNSQLYGIYKNPGDNDGWIACKQKGTLVGALNPQFYVSGKGQSQTKGNQMFVDSQGQPYFYHTLASIHEMSYSSGSENGGQLLKIKGKGFDPQATEIKIGDAACDIQTITDTEIQCRTPSAAAAGTMGSSEFYSGGAGMTMFVYKDTGSVNTNDPLDQTMSSLGTPDHTSYLQSMTSYGGFKFNETIGTTYVLTGFFTAPYDGDYRFSVSSAGQSTLFINSKPEYKDSELIVHCTLNGYVRTCESNSEDKVQLQKGHRYLLTAVYNYRSGSGVSPSVRLSARFFTFSAHSKDLGLVSRERQNLDLFEGDVKQETQEIHFEGTPPTEFRFLMTGQQTDDTFQSSSVSSWAEPLTDFTQFRCSYHTHLNIDDLTYAYQGAEAGTPRLKGERGNHVFDEEAYCGRGVFTNSWETFSVPGESGPDLRKFPYICFAVKGSNFRNIMTVRFKMRNANRNTHYWYWRDFAFEGPDANDDEWRYHCYNLLEKIDTMFGDEYRDRNSPLLLSHFRLPYKGSTKHRALVDEFRIMKERIGITRKPSPFPDPSMLVSQVKVHEVANHTEIEFMSKSCDSVKMPLMGIAGAKLEEINTNDTDQVEAYLKDHDEATFVHDDWGGSKVVIKRKQAHSLKRKGTFDLHYKGKSLLNLDANIHSSDFASALTTQLLESGVEVVKEGSCMRRRFSIYWTYSGGDKPEIVLNKTNLVLDGTTDEVRLWTHNNGNMHVNHIGPDFFRSLHTDHQVSMTVRNYPAWCKGQMIGNCDYSYDASENVAASSVSTTASNGVVTATIAGSGFSTDTLMITVKLEGTDQVCAVQSATETEIVCQIANVPAADYNLDVFMDDKGKATTTQQLAVAVSMTITSINPTEGSIGGGKRAHRYRKRISIGRQRRSR